MNDFVTHSPLFTVIFSVLSAVAGQNAPLTPPEPTMMQSKLYGEWAYFPKLEGKVTATHVTFNPYTLPTAGNVTTLDLRDPAKILPTFRDGYIPTPAPWKIHEVR